MSKILVVDDEKSIRSTFEIFLVKEAKWLYLPQMWLQRILSDCNTKKVSMQKLPIPDICYCRYCNG